MRERLKPGTAAPATAVYRVHHYAHRLPHESLIRRGQVLPPCNVCGERVRFEAVMDEPIPIESDRDLKKAG